MAWQDIGRAAAMGLSRQFIKRALPAERKKHGD